MIDDNMNNILKNFASAGSDNPVITDAKTGEKKVINAAVEKDAMKVLLEGIDSQQKSVNQMPADHNMAKNTATKHPASNYLVGGEEGEVPEDEQKLDEIDIAEWQKKAPVQEGGFGDLAQEILNYIPTSLIDRIGVDKVYDIASEITNRSGDTNAESLAGEVIQACKGIKEQISPKQAPQQAMPKKQSLKDMFNSMDEEQENMEQRFKRELHDERAAKALKKGDNGKAELAENADNAIYDLRAHIQNIAYFAQSIDMIGEEMDTNNGETFVALAKKIVKSVQEIRKGRI